MLCVVFATSSRPIIFLHQNYRFGLLVRACPELFSLPLPVCSTAVVSESIECHKCIICASPASFLHTWTIQNNNVFRSIKFIFNKCGTYNNPCRNIFVVWSRFLFSHSINIMYIMYFYFLIKILQEYKRKFGVILAN